MDQGTGRWGMDGRTDGWMDKWGNWRMDGWGIDKWGDWRMDGWVRGWMNEGIDGMDGGMDG